jgi:hypothetical protein
LYVRTLIKEILYLEKVEKEIANSKEKIDIHKNNWGKLSSV